MQRRTCLGLGLAALPPALFAQPAVSLPEFEGMFQQGQAQMRFFGLLIYDIRLWVLERATAQSWAQQALALELVYARDLSGREIARRSLLEMRRQAEIDAAKAARWLAEMEAAFPDVHAGDRITGRYEPDGDTRFFVNGRLQRQVIGSGFGRLFFGIWLSPQSSEAGLRDKLLNGSGAGR